MASSIADALLCLERIELVRFFGAGGAGGALYALLFVSLSFGGANHRLTAIAASTASFLVSFTLYRVWTFPGAELGEAWQQLALYGAKKAVFFTANYYLLRYCVERRAMRQIWAQVLIALIGAPPSYLIVRWIFAP